MKRIVLVAAFACLTALPAVAQTPAAAAAQAPAAQAATATPPAQPLSATLKSMWDGLKLNLVQSAEKMPEADYGFQPTKEVMTFGQLLAHVANSSYLVLRPRQRRGQPQQGRLPEDPHDEGRYREGAERRDGLL